MSGSAINASSDAGSESLMQSRLFQAENDAHSRNHAKIEKSAKDFESILLGSWLQGAESSFATVPGGDADDGESGQMMSLGVQQLATAMVHAGGIGLGRMIANSLEHASEHDAAAQAVTGESAAMIRQGRQLHP